jgi:16S rRNA (adenine1518-N6/adenine1519-N6)-dimethyltransferase
MLSKRELQDLFTRYNFKPLKRLGQHFLIDANIKDKIIETVSPDREDVVMEIGPGFGELTSDLADNAGQVIAVEKDKLLSKILAEGELGKFPNVRLLSQDILNVDIPACAGKKRLKVVGNLPYYATTPIIVFLIENRRHIECATLTVQLEVAKRLLAEPGGKDYGAISCFVQYHTRPHYVHTISRKCFYPQPEVDSSLVRLEMRSAPAVSVRDEELFFKIVRKAFNQRRKTIANSLSSKAFGTIFKRAAVEDALARARVIPTARPERLGLQDFANIANALIT